MRSAGLQRGRAARRDLGDGQRDDSAACRKDKPRYVMGVGTPEEIVQYVAHGRGHDGLRAAHARRAPRAAVHVGRES